jgi:hypothetical protein
MPTGKCISEFKLDLDRLSSHSSVTTEYSPAAAGFFAGNYINAKPGSRFDTKVRLGFMPSNATD